MAVTITIRNVPEDVRNELAARAARSGHSMQAYLSLQLAALAAQPDPDDVLAEIRAAARHYPALDPAAVLDDLHTDRR